MLPRPGGRARWTPGAATAPPQGPPPAGTRCPVPLCCPLLPAPLSPPALPSVSLHPSFTCSLFGPLSPLFLLFSSSFSWFFCFFLLPFFFCSSMSLFLLFSYFHFPIFLLFLFLSSFSFPFFLTLIFSFLFNSFSFHFSLTLFLLPSIFLFSSFSYFSPLLFLF